MPEEFGGQSHKKMESKQSELRQFEVRQSLDGSFEVNLPDDVVIDRAGRKFVTSWEIKKFGTREEVDDAIEAAHEKMS